jgi:hypothetical protein
MVGATVVAIGCGSAPPAITSTASSTLAQQVAAVRAAAAIDDVASARARLTDLRTTVAGLQRQGQINTARAEAILATVAVVDAQLGQEPTTTTTPEPPPTTTTTSTTTDPGKHGHGDGKKSD